MVLVRNRAHNVMSLAPVWFQSVCIIGAGLVLLCVRCVCHWLFVFASNVLSKHVSWRQGAAGCNVSPRTHLEPVEKRSLFKVVRRYYYPFSGLPGLPYENRRTGNLEETPPQ